MPQAQISIENSRTRIFFYLDECILVTWTYVVSSKWSFINDVTPIWTFLSPSYTLCHAFMYQRSTKNAFSYCFESKQLLIYFLFEIAQYNNFPFLTYCSHHSTLQVHGLNILCHNSNLNLIIPLYSELIIISSLPVFEPETSKPPC